MNMTMILCDTCDENVGYMPYFSVVYLTLPAKQTEEYR